MLDSIVGMIMPSDDGYTRTRTMQKISCPKASKLIENRGALRATDRSHRAIRHRQSSSGGHRRRRTTLVSSNDSAVSGVLAGMEDMTLGAPDSGRGQNLDAQDETVVRGKGMHNAGLVITDLTLLVFRRVHKSVFVPGFVCRVPGV